MWVELVLRLDDDTSDDDISRIQEDVEEVLKRHQPSIFTDGTGVVDSWKWDH